MIVKEILKNILIKTKILSKIDLIKRLLHQKNIMMIKSYHYSIRYKCNFYIYKGTKIHISKKADVNINGTICINIPWEESNNYSASFIVLDNATLNVDGYFRFYSGCFVSICPNAKLKLKSGFINRNGNIRCFNKIVIGNNCKISEECIISDSDNHKIINNEKPNSIPIIIEDNVWIGLRSMILKGVTIGKGSIVAGGSVVTKDVPQDSLVGGVPARVIKENIEWE